MEDVISLNKKAYNLIAEEFAQTRKYVWDDILPILRFVKTGDKILDLGCGTGRLYHKLSKIQGVEYIGVDQSLEQIKVAKRENPNGIFLESEMRSLPFADENFDLIFCIATFHHLPDEKSRIEALKEMKRVLKKDGKILMTNWNLLGDWAEEKIKKSDFISVGNGNFNVPWRNSKREIMGERIYHAFTLKELEDLFALAGFKVEENYYIKKGKKSDQKNAENIVTVINNV